MTTQIAINYVSIKKQKRSFCYPGPKDNPWFWHYHIGSTKKAMGHHYSLRAIIPAKYKPKSGLTLY